MRWSYSSGTADRPLIGLTIGDYLDRIADERPDHEAIVCRATASRVSYGELRRQSDVCARGLLAMGIRRGDRVGVWAPNRVEWTVAQFATAKIGVILVNINPAYRASELEYVLRQSGLKLLIFSPRVRSSDYYEILRQVLPGVDRMPRRPDPFRLEGAPEVERLVALDEEPPDGFWSWGELLAAADEVSADELASLQGRLQFDDAINIQYTSGTTGFPKGATLSHHNILNNAYLSGERMRFTPADRLCIPVPLYHCFGMVLGNLLCAAHGATMVYPSETFDALETLATVSAERCTALHGVPTMFIAELNHPRFSEFDLTSLRTGIMAGSPCPVEVMRQVIDRMHMTEVEIGYGMTETSPLSFQTAADDPMERRVSTVGRVLPHTECKVVDPGTGAITPEGEPGELYTRGYCVMLGYWNDNSATARSIDAARWMHTGDLATMQDGYVNIVGRIKDLIIRGGENIFPREIEEYLHSHPDIDDVYAVGVPDLKYGEEIAVWVRRSPGSALDEDGVRSYCRGRIAHYKVPRYVLFTESFPMTVTGKIQKYKLREDSIELLGLRNQITATA